MSTHEHTVTSYDGDEYRVAFTGPVDARLWGIQKFNKRRDDWVDMTPRKESLSFSHKDSLHEVDERHGAHFWNTPEAASEALVAHLKYLRASGAGWRPQRLTDDVIRRAYGG